MPRLRLLEPWRSRLLWASLALNLFAVALLAAPHFMHRRLPGPPGFEGMIERLAHSLNPDDAARFRAAMDAERPNYEAGRVQMEAARHDLAARLQQQPYDPAAVRTALQAMQRNMQVMGGRFDETLAAAVGNMSPTGRTEVAHFMDRRPR